MILFGACRGGHRWKICGDCQGGGRGRDVWVDERAVAKA